MNEDEVESNDLVQDIKCSRKSCPFNDMNEKQCKYFTKKEQNKKND